MNTAVKSHVMRKYTSVQLSLILTSVVTALSAQPTPTLPHLEIIYQHPQPVITTRSQGAEDIKYGFEGGTAVKVGDTYHLFTSEMTDDPFWVKMRHGHWTSTDKIHWQRVSTIRESSGEFAGNDPRASLWSPMVFWHEEENRWNMFYVAYHAAPNTSEQFRWGMKGRIYRAVSEMKGKQGIAGPYKDLSIIMQPDSASDPWEGLQGVDSFYPWKVGNTWYALYGSAQTEKLPISKWLVGYATATTLAGPWKRLSERNPSKIEPRFIENPIVVKLKRGGWICVYDNDKPDAMGWSYSDDGIHWSAGQSLIVQPQAREWSKDVRTVLGLIDEGNDKYTVFYTGFEQPVDWDRLSSGKSEGISCAVGFVEVKIKQK